MGLDKERALFLLCALDFVVKVWEQELGVSYVLGEILTVFRRWKRMGQGGEEGEER